MYTDLNFRFGVTLELEETRWFFTDNVSPIPFAYTVNECLLEYIWARFSYMSIIPPNEIMLWHPWNKNIILGLIQSFYETYDGICKY